MATHVVRVRHDVNEYAGHGLNACADEHHLRCLAASWPACLGTICSLRTTPASEKQAESNACARRRQRVNETEWHVMGLLFLAWCTGIVVRRTGTRGQNFGACCEIFWLARRPI